MQQWQQQERCELSQAEALISQGPPIHTQQQDLRLPAVCSTFPIGKLSGEREEEGKGNKVAQRLRKID
jgi:hypothetical protein